MIEYRRGRYRAGNSHLTKWHITKQEVALCGSPKPKQDVEHYRSDSLYPGDVCLRCDERETKSASRTAHSA